MTDSLLAVGRQGPWRVSLDGFRGGQPDLAAAVFHHLGIPLDVRGNNPQGRPIPVVTGEGHPIQELS